jgi:hypothetical protein
MKEYIVIIALVILRVEIVVALGGVIVLAMGKHALNVLVMDIVIVILFVLVNGHKT